MASAVALGMSFLSCVTLTAPHLSNDRCLALVVALGNYMCSGVPYHSRALWIGTIVLFIGQKGWTFEEGLWLHPWIPAQHMFLVSGWFLFPCLHTHSYSWKSSCLRHLHIDSHELRFKANIMGSLMTALVLSLLALTLEDFWVSWNIETWKVSIVIDSNYHILSKTKNNSIFHTFKFWILTINGLCMWFNSSAYLAHTMALGSTLRSARWDGDMRGESKWEKRKRNS